jgi:hypothetical protein
VPLEKILIRWLQVLYQVVVRDALGCTETVSTEVKGAASTLKASAVPANAACGQKNGSVRINASGGTGPYSYRIGNGAFGTLSEFKNLSTGSYTATIRDAANCTVEVPFTIRSSNSDLSAIADCYQRFMRTKGWCGGT